MRSWYTKKVFLQPKKGLQRNFKGVSWYSTRRPGHQQRQGGGHPSFGGFPPVRFDSRRRAF
jgi:hypothetical protein